jgi:prepilin-type N-terminal cleavage/methylation domain-containing protein
MNYSKTVSLFKRPQSAGFTLVEMAVVVVIIGILMAMGLATANSYMQNTQRATTKDRADYVRDAMIAYFTANHRLPCPDNGSNVVVGGPRDGVEDRLVGGANPDVTSGCTTALGTVPFLTLGIAREKAIDAYGNFITYRLDTARNWHLTSTFPAQVLPSPPNPFVPCSPPGIIPPVAGLSVYSAPAVQQTNVAAVVLISHGPNGLGAWNQGTTNASRNTLPAIAGEQGNTVAAPVAPAGYRAYVYSDSAAAPFDDVVQQMGLADIQMVMQKIGRRDICN